VLDPIAASRQLVEYALARFSTDNLSCMIVRFDKTALMDTYNNRSDAIGVEGDPSSAPGMISEVDKIVGDAKRKVQEDGVPAIGVSGSNSGKGHELLSHEETFKITSMEKVVEEPGLVDGDTPEMRPDGANIETRSMLSKGTPEGV
jgi:protein phosphatase PTC1